MCNWRASQTQRITPKNKSSAEKINKNRNCFKSVISGWNSFPLRCPSVFWLGSWPGPKGQQGEWLGLQSAFSSSFLYFPDRSSNIHRGFRVMAQFGGCQSLQSSSAPPVSMHLQLLIGNVTRRLLHEEGSSIKSKYSLLFTCFRIKVCEENKDYPKLT